MAKNSFMRKIDCTTFNRSTKRNSRVDMRRIYVNSTNKEECCPIETDKITISIGKPLARYCFISWAHYYISRLELEEKMNNAIQSMKP